MKMLTAIFNTFRSLFRATNTCDVFSFDKDGCHSSKLSASLEFFFWAMRWEHWIHFLAPVNLIIFEICTCTCTQNMVWKVALHPADWERALWDLGGDSEDIRKMIGAMIEIRWWILTRGNTWERWKIIFLVIGALKVSAM